MRMHKLAAALAMAAAAAAWPAAAVPRAAAPPVPFILIPARVASNAPVVVLYSGDGGWADTDRRIAESLAARGMPVVGVNSLRYFWRRRTADQAAADLSQIVANASRLWGRPGVVLAGYSFGAGAVSLVAARLPPAVLAQVQLIVLIAPDPYGEMVLRPQSWLNLPGRQAVPLDAAVRALPQSRVLCIYAVDDPIAACPALGPRIAVRGLTGGHHFRGAGDAVADTIARAARDGPAAP